MLAGKGGRRKAAPFPLDPARTSRGTGRRNTPPGAKFTAAEPFDGGALPRENARPAKGKATAKRREDGEGKVLERRGTVVSIAVSGRRFSAGADIELKGRRGRCWSGALAWRSPPPAAGTLTLPSPAATTEPREGERGARGEWI